jgi:TIR domain
VTDYLYDVFVSYESDDFLVRWIKVHFLPLFRTWLRNSVRATVGRPVLPIFFDCSLIDINFPSDLKLQVTGIEPGGDWKDGLRNGLRYSRCLVTLWNPTYFDSEWCNMEWRSFQRRSNLTGKRLIIPTIFHDGKSFPSEAQVLESIDFKDYMLDGPALLNSRFYEEFQRKIQLLAERTATAIRDAPAFQEWDLDESPPPSAPPAISLPRFSNAR